MIRWAFPAWLADPFTLLEKPRTTTPEQCFSSGVHEFTPGQHAHNKLGKVIPSGLCRWTVSRTVFFHAASFVIYFLLLIGVRQKDR